MAWGYIRGIIQSKKKDKLSEKDDATLLQLIDTPLAGHPKRTEELMPETVAAIALSLRLLDTPLAGQFEETGDLKPETVAAICLALHMRSFSIRPVSSAVAEVVSDAWTQSGRIMLMTDRLKIFNR